MRPKARERRRNEEETGLWSPLPPTEANDRLRGRLPGQAAARLLHWRCGPAGDRAPPPRRLGQGGKGGGGLCPEETPGGTRHADLSMVRRRLPGRAVPGSPERSDAQGLAAAGAATASRLAPDSRLQDAAGAAAGT